MNKHAGQSGAQVGARKATTLLIFIMLGVLAVAGWAQRSRDGGRGSAPKTDGFDNQISSNAQRMLDEGRQIFRFETFGDEAYWSDKLKLHRAIEGAKLGGVGPGV